MGALAQTRRNNAAENRTLEEVLDPQPEASVVIKRFLDWVDRCDLASQAGQPKPVFRTAEGGSIFPEDPDEQWWCSGGSSIIPYSIARWWGGAVARESARTG